jgi:hypothetical protein
MYEVMIQMMKYITYNHINLNQINLLDNNLQFEINIYSFKKDACMDGLGKVWSYNSKLTQRNWKIWGKSQTNEVWGLKQQFLKLVYELGKKFIGQHNGNFYH